MFPAIQELNAPINSRKNSFDIRPETYGRIWVTPNEATMSPTIPINYGKWTKWIFLFLIECRSPYISGSWNEVFTVDTTPITMAPILNENSHVQCCLSLRHMMRTTKWSENDQWRKISFHKLNYPRRD
jgi:hypothetical protein